MPNKEWDEITYPFLNFNGRTVVIMDVIIFHAGIKVKPC